MFSFSRRPRMAEPAARVGDIEVRSPWVRCQPDMPSVAGGFVTLTNTGSQPDRLVGAASPGASKVEIHGIRVVGPGISMVPLKDGLYLHYGTTVEFKPRGYHLMLLLSAPLAVGARLPVELVFERAGKVEISCEVKPPGTIGEQVLHAS